MQAQAATRKATPTLQRTYARAEQHRSPRNLQNPRGVYDCAELAKESLNLPFSASFARWLLLNPRCCGHAGSWQALERCSLIRAIARERFCKQSRNGARMDYQQVEKRVGARETRRIWRSGPERQQSRGASLRNSEMRAHGPKDRPELRALIRGGPLG